MFSFKISSNSRFRFGVKFSFSVFIPRSQVFILFALRGIDLANFIANDVTLIYIVPKMVLRRILIVSLVGLSILVTHILFWGCTIAFASKYFVRD